MKVSAQSSAICQPCFDKNTVESTSLIRDLELEIFLFFFKQEAETSTLTRAILAKNKILYLYAVNTKHPRLIL